MLEVGDVLHTWALRELPRAWRVAHVATAAVDLCCPPLATGNTVQAEQLPDHRPTYLEYEGLLSGNRGQVHRIDHGTYEGDTVSPLNRQLELAGNTVRGRIILECDEQERWLLHCEPHDSRVDQ